MHMKRSAAGFTLLELMIAVAIVAILATIAVPSYQDAVRKGRRTDAMAALLDLQMAQEKYRANNTSYAGTLGALGYNAVSDEGYYDLAITASSANAFTATATPKSGTAQASDSCTFTITQDGPDVSTAAKKTCWNKT